MRLTTYQVGVAICLVSISFFFGALILAFGFRIQDQPNLQHFHTPTLLWVSTAVILLSSLVFEVARRSLRRAYAKRFKAELLVGCCFGILFLCLQTAGAYNLLAEGIPVQGNPRGSMFYIFMALHGVHLIGGVGWMLYLLNRSRNLEFATETVLRNQRRVVSAAALYWHFMGFLWLVLFFFLLHWSR